MEFSVIHFLGSDIGPYRLSMFVIKGPTVGNPYGPMPQGKSMDVKEVMSLIEDEKRVLCYGFAKKD